LIRGSDPEFVCGDPAGTWPSTYPFIPGHEWSDEVVTVRRGVKESGEHTFAGSIGARLL
jgi:L-iditol 2-dehydrogenase